MGLTITELHNTMRERWKDLFDAVLEKEVRIQELEELNEELDTKIGMQENDSRKLVDVWEYNQALTLNTAMKSNVKFLTSQVSKLEKENKDLIIKSKQLF